MILICSVRLINVRDFTSLVKAESESGLLIKEWCVDPREAKGGDRDVFNERPTREDQAMVMPLVENKAALATGCTIHTSMGDIVGLIIYSRS